MSRFPPLPEIFLARMHAQLGGDFSAFVRAYEESPWRGVRANLLKIPDMPEALRELPVNTDTTQVTAGLGAAFQSLAGLSTAQAVPWCAEGLAFREDLRLGQTLGYLAGLFYIQEPSAMASAAALGAQPGERVLDLCAAPGGKATQIAGAMQGRGLLVANDASPTRAQALVRNIERAGVRNAVVTMEQPRKLAERFGAFFDRVLVDAPCSGEGMFRRDAEALKAYNANKPETCAALQAEILRHAAAMVRPGGRLVYSTCTFNEVENEGTVEKFLAAQKNAGVEFVLERIQRIWPHRSDKTDTGVSFGDSDNYDMRVSFGIGEGHFVAVMTRGDGAEKIEHPMNNSPGCVRTRAERSLLRVAKPVPPAGSAPPEFEDFCRLYLRNGFLPDEALQIINKNVYLIPAGGELRGLFNLHGLRIARSGWHMGEIGKNRFVPSQGLAMGLRKTDARYTVDLPEAEAWRYLRGESLDYDGQYSEKPWLLVCHSRHPLGWARPVQGRLKNHLPTGWVR